MRKFHNDAADNSQVSETCQMIEIDRDQSVYTQSPTRNITLSRRLGNVNAVYPYGRAHNIALAVRHMCVIGYVFMTKSNHISQLSYTFELFAFHIRSLLVT